VVQIHSPRRLSWTYATFSVLICRDVLWTNVDQLKAQSDAFSPFLPGTFNQLGSGSIFNLNNYH
jgi:hypothetical protein